MPKQYLMLVEEEAMANLTKTLTGVQYLEVQGMDIGANNNVKLLVTPVLPPITPIDPSLLSQQPPQESVAPVQEEVANAQ